MSSGSALVARNVRRFREERNLSLAELARRAGLAKQTLSTLETGEGNPTVDTLYAIAKALGISVGRLVSEYGSPVLVVHASEEGWQDHRGSDLRELAEIYGSGLVQMRLTRFRKDHPVVSEPHSVGVLEHVYVLEGRMLLGPIDRLEPLVAGDFIRFPGDVLHSYTSISDESLLLVVRTVPQVPRTGERV